QAHPLVRDPPLEERQALAAVLLGPGGADETARVHLLLPLPEEDECFGAGHLGGSDGLPLGRDVGLQPGAGPLAERLLFGGQCEVHGASSCRSGVRRSAERWFILETAHLRCQGYTRSP